MRDSTSVRVQIVAMVLCGCTLLVSAGAGYFVWASARRRHQVEHSRKRIEVGQVVHALAASVAACSDPDRFDVGGRPKRTLPAPSEWVPATFQDVAVTTSASDWPGEPFRCGGAYPVIPPRTRIKWEQGWLSEGYDTFRQVTAAVDFDGDGTSDEQISAGVACVAYQCTLAPDSVAVAIP